MMIRSSFLPMVIISGCCLMNISWMKHSIRAIICLIRFSPSMPLGRASSSHSCTVSYRRAFDLIKSKAVERLLEVNPQISLSDFELSIIQVTELCFPTTTSKGCYFHFWQSLVRKLQSLGLQATCRDEPTFQSFFQIIAALAFVTLHYV